MKKYGLLSGSALCTAAIISLAAPAHAQTTGGVGSPTPGSTAGQTNGTEPADGSADQQAIVVTGSRIARPNLESTVPITSVPIEELTNQGRVTLGDALNELPNFRSTFSQANSTGAIGTSGLNILDLRGLGTGRTLVLVNGRRHVTSVPGTSTVDVNTIPVELIQRVDVVTGGNSAIYGSDAVAGVVNFVLRRDFEGIRVNGQSGISDEGDRRTSFLGVTAGQNFADGRGNIAISLEAAEGEALFSASRDDITGAFSGRPQFQLTQNTIGEPTTGDGIPDTTLLRVANGGTSEGGTITAACSPALTGARRAAACGGLIGNTGSELGRIYNFLPDGSLIENPCIKDLRPFGSGNCIGGLGTTQRLSGVLQPGYDRKAANLLVSFEFSDALRFFGEAKYVRLESLQESTPAFLPGSLASTFRLDNPFLTTQARTQIATFLGADPTTGLLANGTVGTFTLNRQLLDLGGRGEEHLRETYRIVAGVDGTFNEDWRYELSANYGRFESYYETNGNINRANFNRAIDARQSANGPVCAVNVDADPNNNDPACVPINLFGAERSSAAARQYVTAISSRVQEATQFSILGFVAGDLSQLFELPGGPVSFVLGGEYRREANSSVFDEFTRSGGTFLNSASPFLPPDLEVKEAFAELRIPILANIPFAHELSLEGAARVSDYNVGGTGTVFAYNVGGVYAPVRDVRFRVNYARSVRAPTQSNLFTAGNQTFALPNDPCSGPNINNNPFFKANCAAAGVPATEVINGVVVPFTNQLSSSIAGINAGNPNLREERGESLTVGAVFTPSFLPGFSLAVDYYRINISNAINTLNAQTLLNLCYGSSTGINNEFCANISRNSAGFFASQVGRVVGGGTQNLTPTGTSSFTQAPFNYAQNINEGIDVEAAYRTRIGDDIAFNTRAIVTYVIRKDNFTNINDPTFIDQQLFELGDPRWAGRLTASLDFGAFDLGYTFRFIGKQVVSGSRDGASSYEDQFSVQGRPPFNPDAVPIPFYPLITYHNLQFGWEPDNRFRFYVGVDNVFDQLPPLDLIGTSSGDPYDNIGRFIYAGARINF